MCNYRDNWNQHHKAPDDDDIGLREVFRRICVRMYGWALDLFQMLPNYQGQRAIICYSFVCLADNIGQLLRTNRPDRVPISADMRSHALRCAVPAMQELEGEQKDFIGAFHYLMTVFESVQCQQTVEGVLPHTEVESEHYVNERQTILKALREHVDMRQSVKGYPSPVSLKEGRSLVLLPELYDALYSPHPMAPLVCPLGSPQKGTHGRSDGPPTQVTPFVTPASAPGGTAAMLRMDNRVTSFAETQEGSATDWESETEGIAVPVMGMRLGRMSDEDWGEEDLDMGYHPTSMAADEPPVMEDERIEGAQSVLPPDNYSQEDTGRRAETTVGTTRQPSADDILVAESRYGNPEEENELNVAKGDDQEGGDYDVIMEETYYVQGEEELDYDNDPPVEEDMVVRDADDNPGDEDDDKGEDDLADDNDAAESIRPKEGKDAAVWGRLGTPVGDRSTTDTETGETTNLIKSVLIRSPDGDQTTGKDESRRSCRSDREPTVLSDSGRLSRGYSSDSSRSSCWSTGSKHHHNRKEEKRSETQGTNQLNLPESTTPRQSPWQKQIKMTEPSS